MLDFIHKKRKDIFEKTLAVFVLASFIFSPLSSFSFQKIEKAEAAFNKEINYQGKLTNSSNSAVSDGTYHMMFRLYTSPTAATTTNLWEEDRSTAAGNRITVTNGLFSVLLGSSTALTSVDFNQTLYLGVEVGGSGGSPSWDGEMTPRKKLGAVPAAFEADRLDGLDSSQFIRSDSTNATSTTNTALIITQNGAGDLLNLFDGATEVFSVLDGGNVGVGTAAPTALLDVVSNSAATQYIRHYESSDTGATLRLFHARGTAASPTATCGSDCSSDTLGQIDFAGYDGSSNIVGGRIITEATGNGVWSVGNNGSEMAFYTINTNEATLRERLRFTALGQIKFLNSAHTLSTSALTLSDAYITLTATQGIRPGTDATNAINIQNAAGTAFVSFDSTNGRMGINDTSADFKFETVGSSGSGYLGVTNSTDGDIFQINSSGNVGIGTTTPAATFAVLGSGYFTGGLGVGAVNTNAGTAHVTGQCVTSDTRLRRRRRRGKRSDLKDPKGLTFGSGDNDPSAFGTFLYQGEKEFVYDEVIIKHIEIGDEVQSLDLKTGRFTWAKVIGLIDTGIQPLYQLKTQTGRSIRTTSVHPYLVRKDEYRERRIHTPQKLMRFEVDQSIRIEQYAEDTIISIANKEQKFSVMLPRKVKQTLRGNLRKLGPKLFAPTVFAYGIATAVERSGFRVHELLIDSEYPKHEDVISNVLKSVFPDMDINFGEISKKSPAHYAAHGVHTKRYETDSKIELGELLENAESALRTVTHTHIRRTIRSPRTLLVKDSVVSTDEFVKRGLWTVASALHQGQYIAVAHGNTPTWERIVSIDKLEKERVFDIEIEGTHNFIGNDIIAHNTYIGGNLGVGTTSPNWKLSVSGIGSFDNFVRASYFTATSTTAASTFPYASTTALTVSGNSYLGTVSSGVWNGTTIGVAYGGTGLSSYTQGDVLYASGATTLAGTSTANLKATLALNNVENTALSTWAGSTNLTTLGTITTGTWSGTTIAVNKGGTGQTSFAQGWLHSDGTTFTSSTSPTVAYITATSTTATSTFAGGLSITGTGLNFNTNTKWYQNGQQFLTSSTTSAGNLSIGYQSAAGLDANGGLYSTYLGYQAGNVATSSSYNTGVGYQALKAVVNGGSGYGNNNTAFGYRSLYSNTRGYGNNAFGSQALYSNTTGTQNNALGQYALYTNTSGNDNNAIGNYALYNNTSGYQNSAVGASSMFTNTTGYENTANGYGSLYKNTTGSSNTANGLNSLYSNTTGTYNSAQGSYALYSDTTGSGNSAQGALALYFNTTGSNNSAQGYAALYYNGSATSSTAVGYRAGYGTALYSNQGGTYLGYQSGYSAGNSSDYNTLIGYQSGYGITTGKDNIWLGTATSSSAIANLTTGSQNILIGNNISLPSATASGQLNIGNIIFGTGITTTGSTVSTGNIGIGITSPGHKLSVLGTVAALSSSTVALSVTQYGAGDLLSLKNHLPGATTLAFKTSFNELGSILVPKSSLEIRQKAGVTWAAKTAWDRSDIGSYSKPAFADLDNDGDYDLLIGEQGGTGKAYENTGSATSPTWTAKTTWDAADVGGYASPALTDLDNDGDYDLLMGESLGTSYGYENTGTVTSPTWTAKTAWNTADIGSYSNPRFADLDNDGDYDLLIGEQAGTSKGYENTGSVTSPTWAAKTAWDTADIGDFAAPAFADLDNDGDYDLLIGELVGISKGYENTGTAASPTWTAKSVWDTANVSDYTVPAFVDLDNDGDHDLLIGEWVGVSYGYENTGSNASTYFARTGNVGIGTTTPNWKLSVSGIGSFDDYVRASYFTATSTTATSTFAAGIQATYLNLTGTSATSTASNGLNLSAGCYAINGTCVGGSGSGSGTVNSGTAGYLTYYSSTGTTVDDAGALYWDNSNSRLGVGTTSPNWNLQVAGTRPFFTLSDTSAGANLKHWFLSSQGGNFYIGTSSDAYATSTNSVLTISNNANLGIRMTTTPTEVLSVNGNIYMSAGTASGFIGQSVNNGYNPINNSGTGFLNTAGSFYISVDSNNDQTDQAFIVAKDGSTTNGTQLFNVQESGKVGIGTTSPSWMLSVAGVGSFDDYVRASYFTATSTTATSTFSGGINAGNGNFVYQYSTGTTTIANLETGLMSFVQDSGATTWIDLPVSSGASNGTAQSYSANIDGNPFLTLYAQADGVGTLKNMGVSIGTSTPPYAQLTVTQASSTTDRLFEIVNTASSTLFVINSNGNVGIGTTTPGATLSVAGAGLFNSSLTSFGVNTAPYFTATSTTATSTFAAGIQATYLNLTGTSATSTASNGLNLSAGCYAINGTCVGGSGSGSGTVTSINASGGTTGLTFSGGPITTSGTLTLLGTLAVANGGTGQTSFGQGWLHSDGTTFTSSTSPTMAYITATSTTATSTFLGGFKAGPLHTSGSALGNNIFNIFQNGNVAFNATSTNIFTVNSYLTAARSSDVFTITQPNDASFNNTGSLLQLTNSDTSSTAAVLDVYQEADAGTAINIINNIGSSGIGLNISGSAGPVQGTMISLGNGYLYAGTALKYSTSVSGGLSAFTGDIINLAYDRSSSGTVTDTGSFLDLSRTNTSTSGVFTVNGDLAVFASSCIQTSGTCTDNSNILELNQKTSSASGTVLNVLNSGTGASITTNAGKTGLSTTTPWAQLSVGAHNLSNTTPLFAIASSSTGVAATSTLFVIDGEGRTGIGTTTPWRTFSVSGTIGLSSSLTSEAGSDRYLCMDPTTYEVTDGGVSCGASSRRYKENIMPIDYGLNDVLKLNPVSFTFKEEVTPDSSKHLGFIAEEVYEVLPELVEMNSDGLPESVDYAKVTSVLTKAIQEQQFQIVDIKTKIASSSEQDVIQPIDAVLSSLRIELAEDDTFDIYSSEDTKNPLVSFDDKGNAIFAGDLSANKINAKSISGLEVMTDRISTLSRDVSALSVEGSSEFKNKVAFKGGFEIVGASSTVASIDSLGNAFFDGTVSIDKLVVREIENEGMTLVKDEIFKLSSDLASTTALLVSRISVLESESRRGLDIGGLLNSASVLNIFATTTFDGGLSVRSINSISTSTNDAIEILGDAEFIGRPYMTKDTAGFAVIKKNQKKVDIIFDREYIEQPIVNATLSFDEATTTDAEGREESVFANDVRFLVTNKSVKGFTILINKPAPDNLSWSWSAFAVKNAKVFSSIEEDDVREPEPAPEPPPFLPDDPELLPFPNQEAPLVEIEASTTTPTTTTTPKTDPITPALVPEVIEAVPPTVDEAVEALPALEEPAKSSPVLETPKEAEGQEL